MAVNEQRDTHEPRRFWPTAWKPLALAIAVHLTIVIGYSAFFDFNPSCFLNVGYLFRWADEEHFAPGTVKYSRLAGYDGSDYYIVAQDPFLLHDDIAPTYKSPGTLLRYQRVVYPLLVRLAAAGRRRYFPHAMLLINFASMVGISVLLMKLLARRGVSPWVSLVFVLGGGMLIAFSLNMHMHVCFLLVVSGLYFYERERIGVSAACFAFALITWEMAVLFAGVIGLWELLHRRWKRALCFVLVLVPFFCGQAYFSHKLGGGALPSRHVAIESPFMGMWQAAVELIIPAAKEGPIKFLRKLLILPVGALFVCMLALACWKGWRRRDSVYHLMLILQILFVFVQAKDLWATFSNVMRVNAGVFIPLVLSYRDERDRFSPWLFGWAAVLSALSLVRIFITVNEPYTLIGGG